jgi:hypothetical protein
VAATFIGDFFPPKTYYPRPSIPFYRGSGSRCVHRDCVRESVAIQQYPVISNYSIGVHLGVVCVARVRARRSVREGPPPYCIDSALGAQVLPPGHIGYRRTELPATRVGQKVSGSTVAPVADGHTGAWRTQPMRGGASPACHLGFRGILWDELTEVKAVAAAHTMWQPSTLQLRHAPRSILLGDRTPRRRGCPHATRRVASLRIGASTALVVRLLLVWPRPTRRPRSGRDHTSW